MEVKPYIADSYIGQNLNLFSASQNPLSIDIGCKHKIRFCVLTCYPGLELLGLV